MTAYKEMPPGFWSVPTSISSMQEASVHIANARIEIAFPISSRD